MAGMILYFGPIGREDISIVDADDNNVFEFIKKKADGTEEVSRDRIVVHHGPFRDSYVIDYSTKDFPHPAHIEKILKQYGIDPKNLAGQNLSLLKYKSALDVAKNWMKIGNSTAAEINLEIARDHARKAQIPFDMKEAASAIAKKD